jgi:hypothetical protein
MADFALATSWWLTTNKLPTSWGAGLTTILADDDWPQNWLTIQRLQNDDWPYGNYTGLNELQVWVIAMSWLQNGITYPTATNDPKLTAKNYVGVTRLALASYDLTTNTKMTSFLTYQMNQNNFFLIETTTIQFDLRPSWLQIWLRLGLWGLVTSWTRNIYIWLQQVGVVGWPETTSWQKFDWLQISWLR